MILVDSNLLIYAHLESFPQHAEAREWLDRQLNGPASVGMPWVSLLAFLRIVTNPRIFPNPEPIERATRQVGSWLSNDNVWIPQPTERHKETLSEVLIVSQIYGDLVTDSHIAALCIEHGLTLYSTDGDFARFRGLKWINPLDRNSSSKKE